jgi:hypothetical protein
VTQTNLDRQGFWAVAVGFPLFVSALRLWVEAGGSTATTLVIIQSVEPINLFVTFLATSAWLLSAIGVAVFTIGTLYLASGRPEDEAPPLFATWTAMFPGLVKIAAFVLAAATWQLLYLPLLVLSAYTVLRPALKPRDRWVMAGLTAAAYLVGFGPAAWDAVATRSVMPAALLILPGVLLLTGAAQPLPASMANGLSRTAQFLAIALLVWGTVPLVTAPVLPTEVISVEQKGEASQPIRGHVLEVNDKTTAILREQGGVEYIDNSIIQSRGLCPDPGETPRYRLWIWGYHIEDSLLRAAGRRLRPETLPDPRCRPTVPQRPPSLDLARVYESQALAAATIVRIPMESVGSMTGANKGEWLVGRSSSTRPASRAAATRCGS